MIFYELRELEAVELVELEHRTTRVHPRRSVRRDPDSRARFLLEVPRQHVDDLDLIVWWAIGCLLLSIARAALVPVWLIAAVGLALAANGRVDVTGINGAATYDAAALWGLMALGTLLPSSAFTWAARAPRWIVAVGSYPLTFYVGHLLVLQAALLLL